MGEVLDLAGLSFSVGESFGKKVLLVSSVAIPHNGVHLHVVKTADEVRKLAGQILAAADIMDADLPTATLTTETDDIPF